VSALLFDRDQVDEVQDWTERIDDLGRKSILWIDIDRADRARIEEALETLDLAEASRARLVGEDRRAYFGDFGSYLHVTAFAPSRENGHAGNVAPVDCLVARHWIMTVHETPIAVFDEFRERVTASSGHIGDLDGPEFLADLLAWVLDSYLDEFERIELMLERFDERAMQDATDDANVEICRLVELRQQIGSLRRALVSHRVMFLALARPELEAITSSDHAHRFQMLRGQLEDVVQVARDSRDAVFGSFDVLIARGEQRTNEVMKVLTLGALLFLPGALIAGILGMNFRIGFFEVEWLFWVVCAGIMALAAATLVVARARDWI
jgi:magnesium transporter